MSHLQSHILVVDDDRELRDLVSSLLRKNGFKVDTADGAKQMRKVLKTAKIDLIVLDRVMPEEDGLTICQDLRRTSRIPIIMLTLLGGETDRIVGLEVGADDYIQKPFSPQELIARIKAVIRRSRDLPLSAPVDDARALRFNGWRLDRKRRELFSPDGVEIFLTDGEFELLQAFAEHPQLTLTRDQLLDLTSGRIPTLFDRSVDMQVARLRRRIEPGQNAAKLIKTVRQKGYVFTADVVEED